VLIKAHCPVCGTDVYHNIRLHAFEHLSFEEEREACRYAVESFAHFRRCFTADFHLPIDQTPAIVLPYGSNAPRAREL